MSITEGQIKELKEKSSFYEWQNKCLKEQAIRSIGNREALESKIKQLENENETLKKTSLDNEKLICGLLELYNLAEQQKLQLLGLPKK